jgi:hypothetical protein
MHTGTSQSRPPLSTSQSVLHFLLSSQHCPVEQSPFKLHDSPRQELRHCLSLSTPQQDLYDPQSSLQNSPVQVVAAHVPFIEPQQYSPDPQWESPVHDFPTQDLAHLPPRL